MSQYRTVKKVFLLSHFNTAGAGREKLKVVQHLRIEQSPTDTGFLMLLTTSLFEDPLISSFSSIISPETTLRLEKSSVSSDSFTFMLCMSLSEIVQKAMMFIHRVKYSNPEIHSLYGSIIPSKEIFLMFCVSFWTYFQN